MLFECPQCGKRIDMTLEELALSRKVVVCPQCLNEFLAHGVDVPATMLRNSATSQRASKQIYCHSCGESLPVAGLKFCPYCGASQNLEAAAAVQHPEQDEKTEQQSSTHAIDDGSLTSNEDKTVVEDDAYDMMAHLPLIRPLPRLRSKREVMGGPLLRAVCYITIFILIAIFLFIIYLSYFDEDGSIARSIGLNI